MTLTDEKTNFDGIQAGDKLSTALNYIEFDPDTGHFFAKRTSAGGDSPKGMHIDVDVLAGNGLRQGGLQISMDRASGEDVTWDGNPDAGLKIQVNNRAVNVSGEGATRGIDIIARNRGTYQAWVHGGNINARNDSGATTDDIQGIGTRVENYGVISTSLLGVDVNLSDESNAGRSHTIHGIRIRNTDQSAQPVVDAAILLSHTSTNGFEAFLEAAAAAGDGFVASAVSPTGNTVHALIVKVNGTLAYIPAYSTSNFGN